MTSYVFRRVAPLAATIAISASSVALAEGQNSINLGLAMVPPIGDTRGSAILVEYEHALGSRLALVGRGMRIGYLYDDASYEEDGAATGLGIGLRFFPAGGGRGIYFGGSLATFKSDWDWIDNKGTSYVSRGDGETKGLQWGGEVGYRIALGDKLTLTPAVNIGSWLGADQSCRTSTGRSCGEESSLGFYLAGSLVLGIGF